MSKEITEGKGKWGLNCNVTHCQRPNSAYYYNHVMDAYYCRQCAVKIQRSAVAQGLSFYNDLHLRYDSDGNLKPTQPNLCSEIRLNEPKDCVIPNEIGEI